MYSIQNGNVYFESASEFRQIGLETKIETILIDSETVEDVTYTFDIELGEYVEQSRVERAESQPPTPETDEDKIARLELENVQLRARDAQIQDDNNFIFEALINAGLI